MSDARAAWLPSLPTMPRPIEASWIIPTSLPPSPIPATIERVINLSFSVMSAFWVGRHLQQMTAGALHAILKKREELLVLRILVRAGPSTSKTCYA